MAPVELNEVLKEQLQEIWQEWHLDHRNPVAFLTYGVPLVLHLFKKKEGHRQHHALVLLITAMKTLINRTTLLDNASSKKSRIEGCNFEMQHWKYRAPLQGSRSAFESKLIQPISEIKKAQREHDEYAVGDIVQNVEDVNITEYSERHDVDLGGWLIGLLTNSAYFLPHRRKNFVAEIQVYVSIWKGITEELGELDIILPV
ncbi:hypothetical protein Tco_1283160 [Tanacetum coccineum]